MRSATRTALFAILAGVVTILGVAGVQVALAATSAPARPASTDPPICRLVPAVLQNSQGGQSTAWFHWCGDNPDAPSPVKLWVRQFVGDGFTFDSSQCPKVNPCTIFGVP